jgi:hypothetical protein
MTKYGVLISNKVTGELLAVLELDPSGMLISSSFTTRIHPYSLGKIAGRLLDQPIYKKYADVLARDKVLSPKLMKTETLCIADLINGKAMTLGGVPISARSAQAECG